MRKHLTRIAIVLAVLAAVGFGGYAAYEKFFIQPASSCANCRSFIHWQLNEYAEANGGWYPKGGKDPLDSLAKCVGKDTDVHHFTSHKQAQPLATHWEKHKTFSADLCCYRYVEGLRTDDPGGLVLLYHWEPTRWECSLHKMKVVGRAVSFHPPGHTWEFLPEKQFQEKLAHTLAYLREQGRIPAGGETNQPTGRVNGN